MTERIIFCAISFAAGFYFGYRARKRLAKK